MVFYYPCTEKGTSNTRRTKQAAKKQWSENEKGAVHRHLDRFLIIGKLPGKKSLLACIESENDLHNRSWKNVKDFCRNLIETKKRRGLLT